VGGSAEDPAAEAQNSILALNRTKFCPVHDMKPKVIFHHLLHLLLVQLFIFPHHKGFPLVQVYTSL